MPPKKPGGITHTCSVCYTNLKENQASILCASCRTWVHLKCTNLTTNELKEIAHINKQYGPTWKCDQCKSEVSVILPDDAQDVQNDDALTMDKLEMLFDRKLQSLTATLVDQFETKLNQFKTSVEGNVASIRDEVSKISLSKIIH